MDLRGTNLCYVGGHLAPGWALTQALQKGNLWKAYQEARVISAVKISGIRLFVHLLVIENEGTFELFQTCVPVYSASESIGAQYTPLHAFLAVGADRQTFVELSTDEASLYVGHTESECQ